MSIYTDAAPLLSKGIGVTKFKADNPKPEIVEPKPDVEPVKDDVVAVYNLLLDIEGNNGYRNISRMTSVSLRYVKLIHSEMQAAKTAVWAD